MTNDFLFQTFKSVLDRDTAPIVICNLEHIIIYMNKAAIENYHKDLCGTNLLDCHNERSNELIKKVVDWFGKSSENNIIHTFYNDKKNKDVYMVALRDENGKLIAYYEKHEMRNRDEAPFYDIK